MNKEESLALYEQGKEAWNEWANEMLVKKTKLEEDGKLQIDPMRQEDADQITKDWIAVSSVDFSGHVFEGDAEFSDFIFPYDASFKKATFGKRAGFNNVKFSGRAMFHDVKFGVSAEFTSATFGGWTWFENATFDWAWFGETTFGGWTWFENATFNYAHFDDSIFSSYASFDDSIFNRDTGFYRATFGGDWTTFSRATFCDSAGFSNVKFIGNALFNQVNFEGTTHFEKTIFEKVASFDGISGKGFFSFQGSEFHLVPYFNQAHFKEAPQFDDSDFNKAKTGWKWIRSTDTSSNTTSNWRSLKRLAIQGHDHNRELSFFAEEIKSRRGKQDKAFPHPFNLVAAHGKIWPGGTRYWFGLLYELFSNFGRSIWRPLTWWLVSIFLFSFFYLGQHKATYDQNSTNTQLTCLNRSQDNPATAARFLSIYNGLIIAGFGRSEKLSQSYACLYGGGQDQPVTMPDKVVCAGIIQSIFSTVMIFLLLLALRNKFKIK